MTRSWIVAALLTSLVGAAYPAAAAGSDGPAPAGPRAKRAAKIPYRLVKLMPEQDQAVVYDREHREHLLVQIGDDLGDFQVIDVDDEELVLWRDGREIVLTVDASAPAPRAMLVHRPPRVVSATEPAELPAAPPAPAPAASAPALLDPYGVPPVVAVLPVPAPIDPYGAPPAPPAAAPDGPTVVLAPPEQRASLEDADLIDPYAEPPAPTVVPAPVAAEPVKGVPARTSEAARAVELRSAVMPLQRAQLDAAVASFDKLARDHGFERTPRGVRLQRVAPGSFAYAMGLRAGDVITAIDGAPLRGLDDVAATYVGLDSATQLSLDIERGGTRGTLRFTLR